MTMDKPFFQPTYHYCSQCETILRIINRYEYNDMGVTKSMIQEEIFGSSRNDAHHHSLDTCIEELEDKGYIYVAPSPHLRVKGLYLGEKLDNMILNENIWAGLVEGTTFIYGRDKGFSWRYFLTRHSFKCKHCDAQNRFIETQKVAKNRHDEYRFDIIDTLSYRCSNCGFSYHHYFVTIDDD